jgi:hypothetical protein
VAVDFEDLSMMGLEKCTKQLVLNVRRNAKFLSNQQKANQFIAKIAL